MLFQRLNLNSNISGFEYFIKFIWIDTIFRRFELLNTIFRRFVHYGPNLARPNSQSAGFEAERPALPRFRPSPMGRPAGLKPSWGSRAGEKSPSGVFTPAIGGAQPILARRRRGEVGRTPWKQGGVVTQVWVKRGKRLTGRRSPRWWRLEDGRQWR
jgi:hypothetical protein